MKNSLILAVAFGFIATSSVLQAQEHDSATCSGVCPATQAIAVAATLSEADQEEQEAEMSDIVDTAAGNEAFGTLVAAVKTAELVEVLKGEGPFTVFAPTNEAFAKLPEGTVESLLLPENREKLVAILKYHVVSGKVMAADVTQLESAETVLGKNLAIRVEEGAVMINESKVVKADVGCSNGVIHVVDTVILPPTDG